jgi:Zn-dependent protease with chaperone function
LSTPTDNSDSSPASADAETVSVRSQLRRSFLKSLILPILLLGFFAVAPTWLNHKLHEGVNQGIEADPQLGFIEKAERKDAFDRIDFQRVAFEAPSEFSGLHARMRESGVVGQFQRLRWALHLSLVLAGLLLAAICGTWWLNRKAGRSRDALIHAYRDAWRLTVSASLLKVLLLSPLLAYAIFELTTLAADRYFPQAIIAVAIGGLLMLWRGATILLRKVPLEFEETMARSVTAAEAPELWAAVREAAARLRTDPPDHVLVGMQLNFYVTELAVKHDGGRVEGRTLFLSQPMLRQLSTEEVVAIVGHELGHFIGEDTRITREFYPFRFKAHATLFALAQSGWVGWPSLHVLNFFHWSFGASEQAMSREREFAADRVAAELTSPAVAARALVRFHLVNEAYALGITGEGGRRLDNPLDAPLSGFIRERLLPDSAFWERLLKQTTPHPLDSHPPLRDRLAGLGQSVDIEALKAQAVADGETAYDRWLVAHADLFAEQTRKAAQNVEKVRAQLDIKQADYGTSEGRALLERHFPEVKWRTRSFPVWLCLFACGVFGLAALAFVITGEPVWLKAIFGLVGAIIAAIAIGCWRRHHGGEFTLRADSLSYTGWKRPLRFADVERVALSNTNGSLSITFVLKAKAPMIYRYSPSNWTRKSVAVGLSWIKGKQPQVAETIYRYYTREIPPT